jgi:hypothetical protein
LGATDSSATYFFLMPLVGKCIAVISLAVAHGKSGAQLLYSIDAPLSGAPLLALILVAHQDQYVTLL